MLCSAVDEPARGGEAEAAYSASDQIRAFGVRPKFRDYVWNLLGIEFNNDFTDMLCCLHVSKCRHRIAGGKPGARNWSKRSTREAVRQKSSKGAAASA